MNFLEGRLDHAGRRFIHQDFSLPLSPPILSRLQDRERVTIGVRPEAVRISAAERADGWPARVYVTELMGNETFVFLQLGAEQIVARASADVLLEIETRVWASFDERALHFFDAASGVALASGADHS
jgi:ABC-type sugar transport system ATPase subunit